MPAKGPPLDYDPPDGHQVRIPVYEDVYVPTERDTAEHLRRWGLPAVPPVKAPPGMGRQADEAREEERRAREDAEVQRRAEACVEAEVQRRAEARVLEMLDPSGDLRRGLLEGDPWQEAPAQEEVRGGSAAGLPGPGREIRVADASRPEYQPAPNTDSNIPSNTLPTAGMPRWSHGGGAASQPDSMLNVTGAAPDHGDPERKREEDEEPFWR